MQNRPNSLKLLYICSSQFSGSTLTSFLLNLHTDIATIGHTTGWRYSEDEDFRCSCGEKIGDCDLFTEIETQFNLNNLEYSPRNFGTAFRAVHNSRINQLMTGALPGIRSSTIEKSRDSLINLIPAFHNRLERQNLANLILMRTVLKRLNAQMYLDNSHSPYRMRRLHESGQFDTYPIHLIRDPRGVCLSMMTNSGLTAEEAIGSWMRHQLAIMRIAHEVRKPLMLSYEKLCTNTNSQLARIHRFAGLEEQTSTGSFKSKEHHILGNQMRLKSGSVKLDERWRQDLNATQRNVVENRLRNFTRHNAEHPLSQVISDYLDKDYQEPSAPDANT